MEALYVDVERLRPLAASPVGYVGFLDLQAVLALDFYAGRRAVFVLRDAGIIDRFPRGLNKPDYMLTHIAKRGLALGANDTKAWITGSTIDNVFVVAQDVGLSIASLTVSQRGCAALAITLSVGAGRQPALEDRVRRFIERLEQQAALPQLRLALVQEARAARGGEG